MSNNCIIVTGGAGYIGSHVCKELARAGYLPVVFDNLVNGHERVVQWGPLEKGDVLEHSDLLRVLTHYRPSAIMHFAAFTDTAESLADPAKYYRNNVVGSLHLIEVALELGIERFVFSSSCATYGIPEIVPIAEDCVQSPINPYGWSKLIVERMLLDFCASHGLRSMILRYFNAAGADPENQIGEDHDPETHLIPLVLGAAMGEREAVTINGDDYDTPDGTCIRDFVHVSDLAEAHLLALNALEDGSPSNVYNVGCGQGRSIREVIGHASNIVGRDVPVKIGPRRAGDPERLVADIGKIERELGWRPMRSDLSTIIETAWAWCRAAKS